MTQKCAWPDVRIGQVKDLQAAIEQFYAALSKLERKVLMAYLDGKSYQEIADELNRHVKSIDNALQRVKRKLERTLDAEAAVAHPQSALKAIPR